MIGRELLFDDTMNDKELVELSPVDIFAHQFDSEENDGEDRCVLLSSEDRHV